MVGGCSQTYGSVGTCTVMKKSDNFIIFEMIKCLLEAVGITTEAVTISSVVSSSVVSSGATVVAVVNGYQKCFWVSTENVRGWIVSYSFQLVHKSLAVVGTAAMACQTANRSGMPASRVFLQSDKHRKVCSQCHEAILSSLLEQSVDNDHQECLVPLRMPRVPKKPVTFWSTFSSLFHDLFEPKTKTELKLVVCAS